MNKQILKAEQKYPFGFFKVDKLKRFYNAKQDITASLFRKLNEQIKDGVEYKFKIDTIIMIDTYFKYERLEIIELDYLLKTDFPYDRQIIIICEMEVEVLNNR